MAAASAGQQLQQQQQQHQHKLNIVGNAAEMVAGQMQQQQQQQQLCIYKQQQHPQLLQHQQQQFYQQQQSKFVSRVVTNATMQSQLQQQQQILPAGLVNVAAQQQQQQQQQRHSQHIFVCPTNSSQLQQQQQQQQLQQQQQQHHQQQQQQQQAKQRQTHIKQPVKSAVTAATVASTHCMPATIASRQMSQNSQQQQQQQQQHQQQQQQHQPQLQAKNVAKSNYNSNNNNVNISNNNNNNNNNANLAPGWRRLTNNNEVAYISPTGETLRTQFQIKDYLLSQGTCKCGLPCPLRPEYFFDFNAQVPNMPLKTVPADGCQETSAVAATSLCSHQRHLLVSEQLQQAKPFKDIAVAGSAVDDIFTMLPTTTTTTTTTTSATATATVPTTTATTTTTTLEMANKDADCHKYGNNNNNNHGSSSNKLTSRGAGAMASPIPVTPSSGTSQTEVTYRAADHVIKLATQAALPVSTAGAVAAAPAPNFKDDPAGYLQQQTALLNNTLGVGLDAKPAPAPAPGTGTARSLPQEVMVHSSQQLQRQRMRRPSLFACGKWESEQNLGSRSVQKAQVQMAQESPISSSATELEKRPEQVGAISTSHESPRHSMPSPTDSLDSPKLQLRPPQTQVQPQQQAQLRVLRQAVALPGQRTPTNGHGSGASTITRNIVTTTAGISRPVANSAVAQLQANGGNQLIMTSSGQLLVIPSTSKPQQATASQAQRTAQSTGGYIVSQSASQLLNANGAKLLQQHQIGQTPASTASPQTVLLNTLSNGGYIVHQQQQPTEQILTMPQPVAAVPAQPLPILSSPETKRRQRKRKNSINGTPPPGSSPVKTHSPQISPSIPSQAPALLQQAVPQSQPPPPPPQFSQQFQLSPGIQGIVVNKTAATASPQTQQLLLQNGQILQQVNLIGQQLLMPAGLVMGPDATLLQIQNMPTTSLLTSQGPVMLRTPSPQHKPAFISPSTAGGQQYIVGANGQLSPIGQIYSTPMGLVMPTAQQSNASFVQASPTATIQIQQHQPQQHQAQQQQISLQQPQTAANFVSESLSSRQMTAASPPDTTTCSPRSPERPPSHRSIGSGDMVQCVSSSEPDAAISPQSVESRQSPSSTDCERTICSSNVFSQSSSIYKPSEPKIRRIQITSASQAPTDGVLLTQESQSPTTTQLPIQLDGPPAAPRKSNCRTPIKRTRRPHRLSPGGCPAALPPRTFAIGELIWGPARGHPAWPGKIVKMPDGVCTPSQQFDHVWVQWFGGGGRSTSELIPVNSLQSLSEGLEVHHKAQKDTRKSRKLNSQLERAIQEAMTELDNISASAPATPTVPATAVVGHQLQIQQQPTSTNNNINGFARGKRTATPSAGNMTLTASTTVSLSGLFNQQRAKPIRIAPAPPSGVPAATSVSASTAAEILKLSK